jgi:hypothetical protein
MEALTLGEGPSAVELLLHERPSRPTMAGVALSVICLATALP